MIKKHWNKYILVDEAIAKTSNILNIIYKEQKSNLFTLTK